jgi:hypothetical protein
VDEAAATAEPAPSEPLVVGRETLSAGPALVCRSGIVWAARLRPADPAAGGVVVTIVGRGVEPESVRLQSVADLRPMIEARTEMITARIERGRRQPPRPLPELEPAEGLAALLALTEFTLASNAELRAALRNRQRSQRGPDWGGLRSALWQRAVGEQQRLRGTDAQTADDVVTSTVNHPGFLQENAPWFTANPRLRAAAIDETLRHAMLGDEVPSDPAQAAWTRYWSTRMARSRRYLEPAVLPAEVSNWEALSADCLVAWTAWTAGPGTA